MKSELIVDAQPSEVSIALLEDSRLVSLQKEARNISYAVGDIYLAKVKKLMPGLNAAFVNVGYEKDAFLHYLDLGPHYASYKAYISQLLGGDRKKVPALERMKLLPDIDKHGTVTDMLTQGQELLVQIVKEPISSKGPRLTTEISFTGRFMVLIPFSDKISISQKIKSTEEKMRLRQLIESIKPKNFGVIVRTSAEGKRVAELVNELNTLVDCWNTTVAKAQKASAPALIFEEESRIVGMLRDVFSPSFETIHVNDSDTFKQIRNYVQLIAPERADIVKLYTKPEPIFDTFAITRQIKSSFGKTVSFRSGAYIIIESTEALHVIDVNSGNRSRAANDQETNALEVNLRAADEIARQLRLRDMGGIIVVDFIDMAKGEHRQQLYEHMREVMGNDRARHNILPLSKFGLMQITRQRVRPALDITTAETCPCCNGKGEIQPSLLFTDTLREKLEYLVNTLAVKNFTMYIHPFVDAYVKRGWLMSMYRKWRRQIGGNFRILPDEALAYLQYRVIGPDGNEIDLVNEKDMNASSVEKVKNKAKTRGNDTEETAERPADSTENTDTPATPAPGQGLSKSAKSRRRKRARKEAAEAAAAAAAAVENASAEVADVTPPEQLEPEPVAPKPERPRKPKAKPETPAESPAETPEETPQAVEPSSEAPAEMPKRLKAPRKPKALPALREEADNRNLPAVVPAPIEVADASADAQDAPADEAATAPEEKKPRKRRSRSKAKKTDATDSSAEAASEPLTANIQDPTPEE